MTTITQPTLWSEEAPAKASASQDSGRRWTTHAASSCQHISELVSKLTQNGLSGKTCPEYYQQITDALSAHSCKSWPNSGLMGGRLGECSTLNSTEWHSAAAVCSLSSTLETGGVPRRYFLSARACAGIIRRARKRGKPLPEDLQEALEQQLEALTPTQPQEDSSGRETRA